MFQFHTGSIKSFIERGISAPVRTFQFHTGSIKSSVSNHSTAKACAWFQFHTGSIKSGNIAANRNGLPKFQFHTGSIKRSGWPQMNHRTKSVSIPYWFD